MDKPRFKSVFSCKLNKLSGAELDKYVALAGLDTLKSLMPKDIDLAANPDLMGVVLNAAVAGRMNANGDSISNETAIEITKNFKWKLCDNSHKRSEVCGVICNYGFSKFGSNEILTEEDAKNSADPFNMSLALVLYKSIMAEDFIKRVEDSADESSENFQNTSASWELFFDDYDIAVGTKNVAECELITDPEEKKKLEPYLLANGGKGKKDGKFVFRVIKNEFLIPAGVGLVEYPAAEVKGLAIIDPQEQQTPEESMSAIKKIPVTQKEIEAFKDFIKPLFAASQTMESDINQILELLLMLDVNLTDENRFKSVTNNNDTMKITKITDVTDETLKQCSAADIGAVFEAGIREANEKWEKEVKAKEGAMAEVEAKNKTLAEEQAKLTAKLAEIEAAFATLKAANEAREKEEKFNARMAELSEAYELTDEERKVIVAEVKDLTDEQYVAYSEKMKVLLKSKSKAAIAAVKEQAEKAKLAVAAEAPKTPEVATEAAGELGKALEAGTKTLEIPNATGGEKSVKNAYLEAFSPEKCITK